MVGWLRGRNIVGDVFLPGCELLTPDRAGGFGAHWRNAARSLVRDPETYGWLDPATGQTVAAPADERGWPVFNATVAPAGWYYDLPGAGEPAVRAPSDSPLPDRAADWRMSTASVNSIVDFSAPASSRPVHGASGEAPADGGGARDGFPGQSTSRGSVTMPNDRREADKKSNGLPHPLLRKDSAPGALPSQRRARAGGLGSRRRTTDEKPT